MGIKMNKQQIVTLGFAVLLTAQTLPSLAAPPLPPASVDAGTVFQNRYKGYEETPEPLKTKDVDVESKSVKTPYVGTVASDDIIMYLEHVDFTGNTVIKSADLQALAAKEIIGRDVTLTRLGKFAEQVTKMYQDQGYITSFAFLPPQTIKDKTATIQIIEGKIGDVNIDGNKFSTTNFIKYQLLKPYYVEKDQILNVNDIRQGLIELNEKGFISGSIVLEKGAEQYTTNVNLNVKEHQPFTTSVNFDNAGRDLIGLYRWSAFVSDNNLTGHGDVLSVGTSIARRSFNVGPQYTLPIDNRGDKVYASYGYSRVRPGGEIFGPIDYLGNAHIVSVGMRNPVYESRKVNVDLDTSFNIKEGSFTANIQNDPISKYGIRSLETSLQAVQKDKYGRTYANVGANIGMPILGGERDSHYMIVNGGVTRQFWLPKKGIAILRFNGQVSPDSDVHAIEQFQVGGFNTVRGYNEGTLLGKSGWTAGVQVNESIPFLPQSIPIWKKGDNIYRLPVKDRIQLIGFYDCGYATARTASYDPGAEFIQSVGFGTRVYLTKYLTASVDFGFPIGERPEGANRFRTHFFLTSNIL